MCHQHAGLSVKLLQLCGVVHTGDDVLLQDGHNQAAVLHEPVDVLWAGAQFVLQAGKDECL